MSTKSDFTDDEWTTLVCSPMVSGMAITLADPGGLDRGHEGDLRGPQICSLGSSSEQRDDLVGELARETRGLVEQRKNPVGDFKPRGRNGRQGDSR